MKRYIRNVVDVDTKLSVIEAMSTIGIFGNSICLVTPDTHRIGQPYFKVANNRSYNKADSIARISFLEPRYIVGHTDTTGKKSYKLNSKQIKELVKFFNSRNVLLQVSYWLFAICIYQYNVDYGFILNSGTKDGNL